ncbi:hypothetical protein [Kribbella swartbergensis]
MARLTDEDLERLLRETFADKESLVDDVPEATTARRPITPILLAAAAVLVILTGILYGVSPGETEPEPPVAAAPPTDADLWAAAIVAVAERYEPPAGWKSLALLDHPETSTRTSLESSAVKFSAAEKRRITEQVSKVGPVRWTATPGGIGGCSNLGLARIAVGPVVDKVDHKEVPTMIDLECGRGYRLTYRLEDQGGWKVAGMVGPVLVSLPVSCVQALENRASPREGC